MRFLRNEQGGIAVMTAVMFPVLILLVGGGLDLSRALSVREDLAQAADHAAFAVAANADIVDDAAATIFAQDYIDANFGAPHGATGTTAQVTMTEQEVDIVAHSNVPTMFAQIIGMVTIPVGTHSVVSKEQKKLEIALVLDTSGSGQITTIAAHLNQFVDSLPSTTAKVAVVPFAGAVNVGPQFENAAWLGDNAYQGDEQEANGSPPFDNRLAFTNLQTSTGGNVTWGGCVEARPIPADAEDTTSPKFVHYFAPDEPDNWNCSPGSACSPGTGLSVAAGPAYNGTPTGSRSYNSYLPDSGNIDTCSGLFRIWSQANATSDRVTASPAPPVVNEQLCFIGPQPPGLAVNTRYYLATPTPPTHGVSDTFNGTRENITANAAGGTVNNQYALLRSWTCNGAANCLGNSHGKSEQDAMGGVNTPVVNCKYGSGGVGGVKATVTANLVVKGYPGGPNHGCTAKPLLALTTLTGGGKQTVKDKINSLIAQGQTDIGEGVAWGWRTLSPGVPFTDGVQYDDPDTKKILVLVSASGDFENTFIPNGKFTRSSYSARGYINMDHLGIGSTPTATQVKDAMDARMLAACANAKAAGVEIYAWPLDEQVLPLMEQCVTDTNHIFYDVTTLVLMIQDIRLTQ